MTIRIESQIYLYCVCEECGHEWDYEDEDSQSVPQAEALFLEREQCPNCAGNED
mgnify:CR=1 FL=1